MRTTIDFGIDLGTTNSSIAVMDGMTPKVIKNNDGTENTPSCVYIDKNKKTYVGRLAYQRLENDPGNTKSEFKREMGKDMEFHFLSSGEKRKPEQLSAEVLKTLKASVEQRTGEEVRAAVITAPAGFLLPSVEATKKAAELSGIHCCAILQEPVAAATAYGFQSKEKQAFWLVYDFGGGTFDVAVIELKEGIFRVMGDDGDDKMGGKNMDWKILSTYFLPVIKEQTGIEDLVRGNEAYAGALAKLKIQAEKAKIQLSNYESTPVLIENLFPGKDYIFECELTREQVAKAVTPLIKKSIKICKAIIKKQDLETKDIQKVILVGGPTLAPYLREMLQDPKKGLGIPLEFSVDPFTVVAQGAAIFAHTQQIDKGLLPKVKDAVAIELNYEPIGDNEEPLIGGRISSEKVEDFNGYHIQIDREGWTSGHIALQSNGAFLTSLVAERGVDNNFTISVFDPEGGQLKTSPDTFSYIIGNAPGQQRLTHSICVALMNNQVVKFFNKGDGLPAKKMLVLKSGVDVQTGNSKDVICVPVVEGEDPHADYNQNIGKLVISGENFKRDLPIGSDVEVTLEIDSNRLITTSAYIPILDEEFSKVINLNIPKMDRELLNEELEKENQRLTSLKEKAVANKNAGATKSLSAAEKEHDQKEIKVLIRAAENEEDDTDRQAKHEIMEFRKDLDQIEDDLQWPLLEQEARALIANMRDILTRVGDSQVAQKSEELIGQLEAALAEKDSSLVRLYLQELNNLQFTIFAEQPGFWMHLFNNFRENPDTPFIDKSRAEKLVREGEAAIKGNNIDKLKMIVAQLYALLPREQAARLTRGFGSTLMQ